MIERALGLCAGGDLDAALDLAAAHVDGMLCAGRFAELDALLAVLREHAATAPVELLAGFLVCAAPAAGGLPSRAALFAAVRERARRELPADEFERLYAVWS